MRKPHNRRLYRSPSIITILASGNMRQGDMKQMTNS